MSAIHVFPVNDLVGHDTSGQPCVCGPTECPGTAKDGSPQQVVVHNSLDGRERYEVDRETGS